jgi:DtxR family Mn-dependent transcriptional regulator
MSSTDSTDRRHSRAVEDYVKQIYKLTEAGDRATTKALAERMALGQGTVSGMIKQLASRGLVHHEPYYGAQLTESGRELAMKMLRKHRLIELFLVKTLGFGWHEVDDDAERLEHAVSDKLIERIDEHLGKPDVDPHGAPIPDSSGKIKGQDFRPLSDLQPGESGTVRRVADSESELLEFLREQGVALNGEVKVTRTGPFGSMQIEVGNKQMQLPREAAERIAVSCGD